MPLSSRDGAFTPVAAAILLVLIAVVAAAGVHVFASGFDLRDRAPSVGVVARTEPCAPRLLVTSVSGPVDTANVRVAPQDSGGSYAIRFGGRITVDEPWRGRPPSDLLAGGSVVDLWAEQGRAFALADDASGHLLAVLRAPSQPRDAAAPSAAPDAATFVAPAEALAGTAADAGCAGVASVVVHVTDGVEAWPTSATLASPGAAASAWTADVADLPLVAGRTYSVTATARDMAGNVG